MSAAPRFDEMDEPDSDETETSPGPTSDIPVGGLVPQAHGGAIRRGNPGNRGGRGLRDAVRLAALEGAQQAVPKLVAMLNAGECEHCGRSGSDEQTVARVSDTLLRYGLGQQKEISVEAVRNKVADTLDVIRRHAPPELAQIILAELRGVWT